MDMKAAPTHKRPAGKSINSGILRDKTNEKNYFTKLLSLKTKIISRKVWTLLKKPNKSRFYIKMKLMSCFAIKNNLVINSFYR